MGAIICCFPLPASPSRGTTAPSSSHGRGPSDRIVRRQSHAKFLGMLCVREAIDDPPLVVVKDAVMPLAHRQVEAESVYEPAVRTPAIVCWKSDLMRPAAIYRGSGKLAFPSDHRRP